MIEFLSTYSYFTGLLYFLAVWVVVFFISSKRNRKEMFAMSVLGISSGIFGGLYYTVDWWHPLRLFPFNTPIGQFGLEDAVFGFTVFGVASVIVETVFKCESRPQNSTRRTTLVVLGLSLIALTLLLVTKQVLGLHTFYASLISTAVIAIIFAYKSRLLLMHGLWGGVALTIVAIPAYLIPLFFNPNWIASEWKLEHLSGFTFLSVPIEEFIWFFFIGFLVSIFWEYARGIAFCNSGKKKIA